MFLLGVIWEEVHKGVDDGVAEDVPEGVAEVVDEVVVGAIQMRPVAGSLVQLSLPSLVSRLGG